VIYDGFEPNNKFKCTGSNQVCTSDRTLRTGREATPIYRIYRANLFGSLMKNRVPFTPFSIYFERQKERRKIVVARQQGEINNF